LKSTIYFLNNDIENRLFIQDSCFVQNRYSYFIALDDFDHFKTPIDSSVAFCQSPREF